MCLDWRRGCFSLIGLPSLDSSHKTGVAHHFRPRIIWRASAAHIPRKA
jgi:hypothetical protein